MITEIEVDRIGTMRHLNNWQILRLHGVKPENVLHTQICDEPGHVAC